MNNAVKYIGDKVDYLKDNQLYKTYFNGNEQLLYVLIGIIIIYLLFYLLSGLYSLPLIIFIGAIMGVTIQNKYNSFSSSSKN